MKHFLQVILFSGIALLAACSSDAGKRSAYYTLQNAGQQECEKNPSASCNQGKSYDQYQRERERLKTAPNP